MARNLAPAASGGCNDGRSSVHLCQDPCGETAHRFNALWYPRAYVVDGRNRLLYVQPDTASDADAMVEITRRFARQHNLP